MTITLAFTGGMLLGAFLGVVVMCLLFITRSRGNYADAEAEANCPYKVEPPPNDTSHGEVVDTSSIKQPVWANRLLMSEQPYNAPDRRAYRTFSPWPQCSTPHTCKEREYCAADCSPGDKGFVLHVPGAVIHPNTRG